MNLDPHVPVIVRVERRRPPNLFQNWRTRRGLLRQIAIEKSELADLTRRIAENYLHPNAEEEAKFREEIPGMWQRLEAASEHLSWHDSNVLRYKAERLGIDIPSAKDKPDWWKVYPEPRTSKLEVPDAVESPEPWEWLSEQGQTGVRKLIRLEQRANFEW